MERLKKDPVRYALYKQKKREYKLKRRQAPDAHGGAGNTDDGVAQ